MNIQRNSTNSKKYSTVVTRRSNRWRNSLTKKSSSIMPLETKNYSSLFNKMQAKANKPSKYWKTTRNFWQEKQKSSRKVITLLFSQFQQLNEVVIAGQNEITLSQNENYIREDEYREKDLYCRKSENDTITHGNQRTDYGIR